MTDLFVDPGYSPYVYDYVPESSVPDNIWSPGYDYNWDPLNIDGPDSTSSVPDNIWSPGYDYNWDPLNIDGPDSADSSGYDYTTEDSTAE